jgi:hypothetical protein
MDGWMRADGWWQELGGSQGGTVVFACLHRVQMDRSPIFEQGTS